MIQCNSCHCPIVLQLINQAYALSLLCMVSHCAVTAWKTSLTRDVTVSISVCGTSSPKRWRNLSGCQRRHATRYARLGEPGAQSFSVNSNTSVLQGGQGTFEGSNGLGGFA